MAEVDEPANWVVDFTLGIITKRDAIVRLTILLENTRFSDGISNRQFYYIKLYSYRHTVMTGRQVVAKCNVFRRFGKVAS